MYYRLNKNGKFCSRRDKCREQNLPTYSTMSKKYLMSNLTNYCYLNVFAIQSLDSEFACVSDR